MAFWRTLYYFIGIEYIGSREQAQIDRQKHLKHLMCKQIRDSDIKLFQVVKSKSRKKRKK